MTHLSKNCNKLLKERYLLRNQEGIIIEEPQQLFRRVAKAVAIAEKKWNEKENIHQWEEIFYSMMHKLQFLPNSPTLMNAGHQNQQLSACFVLPIFNSMQSIHDATKFAEIIQKSGGGIGFNFTNIAPKNTHSLEVCHHLSGPLSIIEDLNKLTENIKQSARRRGANMAILDIDHPDIEEFINFKFDETALNNFNLSVAITDKFMNAVEQNNNWDLIHPHYKHTVKSINARELWGQIINAAWKTGDPGVIFIDTINQYNPTSKIGKINATNPCGEVPLLPYESCNLGSLNLSKFVRSNKNRYEIDWRNLEKTIAHAIRFLDNVVEVNQYQSPEIKQATLGNRKIGLGIMGWAELLTQLEIPYDSDKAIQLAEQLMRFIQEKAMEASESLAKERGVFPNWEKSIYAPHKPIRNATRTSIAPTSSISIIANTSSSIEPLFALAYQQKHVLQEDVLDHINSSFIELLKEYNIYTESILEKILEDGCAKNINEIPISIRNMYKTAMEIKPEWHIKHLIAFQKFTENAVSKTVNLPKESTPEDVEMIFKTAYFGKAKGISVYRNGSKEKQVINLGIASEMHACNTCLTV